MSRLEFCLQPDLAEALASAVEAQLKASGYTKLLDFSNPEGPDLQQFRRGTAVVTVEIIDEGEDERCLRLHSETADCSELLRAAVLCAAADAVATLLAPVSKLDHEALRAKALQALDGLADHLA